MKERGLPSAKISGSGTIAGGVYEKVSISGSGSLEGDVTAGRIGISGSGKMRGNVTTDYLSISGSGNALGAVRAGELKVSGSASFKQGLSGERHQVSGSMKVVGQMQAEEVVISGSLSVESLKTNRIDLNGSLSCKGDVEAEEFNGKGHFRVDGLLNVNRVDFVFGGGSYAREIGGETIRFTRWQGLGLAHLLSWALDLIGWRKLSQMRADLIEGTVIDLNYCDVKVVRGTQVTIGPGCHIELVEYTESLRVNPDSQVTRAVQV